MTAGSAPADPPGLDLTRLAAYLDTARPGLRRGDLSAELIEGGKSNLTYRLTDGATAWALRRPPLGHVLRTAHDMTREHRVISALGATPVPVPAAVHLCGDPEPIGAPFYLMEYVDGTIFRSADQTAGLSAPRAAAIADTMMDVLADLHDVDVDAVGLGDFGRPAGYLERQLRRWQTQLDASRSRDLPGIDELRADLVARMPAQSTTGLVHGDYRLDNLIVDPAPGAERVLAVLDWEMSTLGDQLTDLGLLLCYWDGVSAMPGAVTSAVGPDSAFPRGRALIDRYAARRDVDLSSLPWYVAFGYFKLAVILEGIYYRHAAGQTVGAGFAGIGTQVYTLIRLGRDALGGHLAEGV